MIGTFESTIMLSLSLLYYLPVCGCDSQGTNTFECVAILQLVLVVPLYGLITNFSENATSNDICHFISCGA